MDFVVLTGKIAFITDAGTGIGAAVARLFAEEGARVALAGRTLGPIERLASEIEDDVTAFALRPMGDFAAYSTSKAALITLTRTIALHCAAKGYNIRANMVHPGGIETEMFEQALVDTGLPRQQAYDLFA